MDPSPQANYHAIGRHIPAFHASQIFFFLCEYWGSRGGDVYSGDVYSGDVYSRTAVISGNFYSPF